MLACAEASRRVRSSIDVRTRASKSHHHSKARIQNTRTPPRTQPAAAGTWRWPDRIVRRFSSQARAKGGAHNISHSDENGLVPLSLSAWAVHTRTLHRSESSGFFPSGGSAKKRTWRVQSLFSSGPRPPQCPRRPSVSYSPPFVPVVGFASASNRLALMATNRGCCSDVGSLFQARRLRRTSTRRPSPLRALPLRRLLLPPRSPRSPRSRRPPPLPRL